MRDIDELRALTAGQILKIWRESRKRTEDPLERTLLCNAEILAACCFFEGEPVFENAAAVLTALTGRQMEHLLGRLAGEASPPSPAWNPAFDPARFEKLREG